MRSARWRIAVAVNSRTSCRSMADWPKRSTQTSPGPLAQISTTWSSSSHGRIGASALSRKTDKLHPGASPLQLPKGLLDRIWIKRRENQIPPHEHDDPGSQAEQH